MEEEMGSCDSNGGWNLPNGGGTAQVYMQMRLLSPGVRTDLTSGPAQSEKQQAICPQQGRWNA